MKYLRLVIFFISLSLAISLVELNLLSVLWMSAPILIPMSIEVMNLCGLTRSPVLPVTGVVLCLIALPVYSSYYFAWSGASTDALALGIMPVMQLVVLALVAVANAVINVFGASKPASIIRSDSSSQ